MKKDDWIKLLFPSIIAWTLGWAVSLMVNIEISIWIFSIILLFLIALLIFTTTFLSEPDIALEFYSRIEPNSHIQADRNQQFRLVWDFTNNLNEQIRILSYNTRINLNGRPIYNFEWKYNYRPIIGGKRQLLKEWSMVGCDYYGLNWDGIYEFQCLIEYELPNEVKKIAYSTCELEVVGTGRMLQPH